MSRVRSTVFLGLLMLAACGPAPEPCSTEWMSWVDATVTTSDKEGHGPDVGSDEWRSVVEFRLGLRGDAAVPRGNADAWCRYVDKAIKDRR
ncbi:MAG: hypothetical protein KJO31_01135 [Gammaproteobacteria bacterium]|nr:hypothetical protein [Gammaproteobacteria bacterium]